MDECWDVRDCAAMAPTNWLARPACITTLLLAIHALPLCLWSTVTRKHVQEKFSFASKRMADDNA